MIEKLEPVKKYMKVTLFEIFFRTIEYYECLCVECALNFTIFI